MPVVKVDYYSIVTMASGVKYVVTASENIPFPSGRSIDWGSFTSNNKYSLEAADGKIYFPMVYSSGNFAKFLMWMAFLALNALVCFLISTRIWKYAKDFKFQRSEVTREVVQAKLCQTET